MTSDELFITVSFYLAVLVGIWAGWHYFVLKRQERIQAQRIKDWERRHNLQLYKKRF